GHSSCGTSAVFVHPAAYTVQGGTQTMRRHEISDEAWDQIKDLLPGKPGDPGQTAADNRLFINALLWIAKTGAPWRDLPEQFGKWNSVFQRFNRLCKRAVWGRILAIFQHPDLEFSMFKPTIARAPPHSA